MDKTKRGLGWLVLIIAAIIICTLAIRHFSSEKNEEVIGAAQEYLQQSYSRQMQFENIRLQEGEPDCYIVGFSQVDEPELTFAVFAWADAQSETGFRMDDNYYRRYFSERLESELLAELQQIWGDDAELQLLSLSDYVGSDGDIAARFSDVDEDTPTAEVEPLLRDYLISISIDGEAPDADSYEAEAERVFAIFELLRGRGFHPSEIECRYRLTDDEGVVLEYADWAELDTVEEIQTKMKDYIKAGEAE